MSRTSRAPVRPSTDSATSSRRSRAVRADSRRVLLVDAAPDAFRRLSHALEDGWFVTTAAGATQATILLDAFKYRALVTDYEMPGQDGIWLLQWTRARHPRVQRILVSTREPAAFAPHLLSGLIQHYLAKPVDRASLLDALGEAEA